MLFFLIKSLHTCVFHCSTLMCGALTLSGLKIERFSLCLHIIHFTKYKVHIFTLELHSPYVLDHID